MRSQIFFTNRKIYFITVFTINWRIMCHYSDQDFNDFHLQTMATISHYYSKLRLRFGFPGTLPILR